MYSPNAAKEAGRRIGRRHADVWVSDEELWVAVVREVGPSVRPRSGRLQRNAQQAMGYTVLLGSTTVFASVLLFGVARYSEADWMPGLVGSIPTDALGWLIAGLAVLTVLTGFTYGLASARAKSERRRLRDHLLNEAYAGAMEELLVRRGKGHRAVPSAPAPVARSTSALYRNANELTPEGAEELAAGWMRRLGATDAQVTRFQGDGGVDVISAKYFAQVKHFASNVGVAPIRELSGVVRVNGRRGLFFTTRGYAKGAIEFANQSGIALFVMDHRADRLEAVNDVAKALKRHGLQY